MGKEGAVGRNCSTCLYFDVYYVQYGNDFAKLNYGFCAHSHDQVQNRNGSCTFWASREKIDGVRSNVTDVERALAAIEEIRQFLEEKKVRQ